MNKTIFMETTKIQAEKTVGQIQEILGLYGARSIQVDYEDGKVRSIAFLILVEEKRIPFRLPCRWEAIFEVLRRRRKIKRFDKEAELEDRDQAKRVAWRQILRWIEAQLALVETNMVKLEEVFMPYIQTSSNGQTLFEKMRDEGYLMLENKSHLIKVESDEQK